MAIRAGPADEQRLMAMLAPVADQLAVAREHGDIAFVIRQPLSAKFAKGFEQLLVSSGQRAPTVVPLRPEIAEMGPWNLVTKAWMRRPIRANQLKVFVLDAEGGGEALLLTVTLAEKPVAIAAESDLRH